MTTFNTERALAVLGRLVINPAAHKQSCWFTFHSAPLLTVAQFAEGAATETSCGTAGCYAGWTMAMYAPKDAVLVKYQDQRVYIPSPDGQYVLDGDDMKYILYVTNIELLRGKRYRFETVKDFATEVLGLTAGQAAFLFSSERNVAELAQAIGYLLNHPEANQFELEREVTDKRVLEILG